MNSIMLRIASNGSKIKIIPKNFSFKRSGSTFRSCSNEHLTMFSPQIVLALCSTIAHFVGICSPE
uniref:Uncharacterized protein n=1 Tax=Klebsiella phage FKP3 TaxID=3231233 RepID=A0AAU8HYW4_9CAUD